MRSTLDDVLSRLPASLPASLPGLFRRVPVVDDVEKVEAIRDGVEVDETSVGLEAGTVDHVWDAVRRVYRTGVHPAMALCLRRDGQVVIDRTIGHARGISTSDRHVPDIAEVLTPDHRFVYASASKALTAMVVHWCDQEQLLHVDDRVCDYLPEFASHGKHNITINHVLSHRAGVPNIPRDALDLDLIGDREHILHHLAEARPTVPPGRFIAYHAVSGGFILGEIVRRVTGRPIEEVLRDDILAPIGVTTMGLGTTADQLDTIVQNHATGLPVLPPLSFVLDRALGLPFDEVIRVFDDPRFLQGVVPSANGIGTADDLCRFYELLRRGGELDGARVFEPRVIRRAVTEQSYMEVDLTLGFPFRYGMGFMLGAEYLSLYGTHTYHAFGHLGFTNIVGWCDPERRVSGALLTSGKPVIGPHLIAIYDVMQRIAAMVPRDGLVDEGVDWA